MSLLLLTFIVIVFVVVALILTVAFILRPVSAGFLSDGFRCKFASLIGHSLPEYEKSRWVFTKFRGEPSRCLIVSFAGGAVRVAGAPQPEFVNTLRPLECDQLFLTDPQQSWYLGDSSNQWNGFAQLEAKLRDTCAQYENVLFVGNCMGAMGALLFCHLCDTVMVFNPFVDLTTELRLLVIKYRGLAKLASILKNIIS